jgi:hypothetical protein
VNEEKALAPWELLLEKRKRKMKEISQMATALH